MLWKYQDRLTLPTKGEVLCLLSRDVPKTDGKPVCPWYKLGDTDVSNPEPRQFNEVVADRAFWTCSATSPEDRPDVRVLVLASDAQKWGKAELVVRPDEVKDGDELVSLKWADGTNEAWYGMTVNAGLIRFQTGSIWGPLADFIKAYPADEFPHYRVRVRRGAVQGAVKNAIPDWPHKCPRCQRAESAVLLFNSWDCKHGCFK